MSGRQPGGPAATVIHPGTMVVGIGDQLAVVAPERRGSAPQVPVDPIVRVLVSPVPIPPGIWFMTLKARATPIGPRFPDRTYSITVRHDGVTRDISISAASHFFTPASQSSGSGNATMSASVTSARSMASSCWKSPTMTVSSPFDAFPSGMLACSRSGYPHI